VEREGGRGNGEERRQEVESVIVDAEVAPRPAGQAVWQWEV
jgi:hypothetical protein